MRSCARILLTAFFSLNLLPAVIRADPGDVENSHDYAAFVRPNGFVISDYDEDNPATFDFPVSRPLAIDAAHVETVHTTGHRYVIRYEVGTDGHPLNLLQIQRYYEKLASDAGYKTLKSGAAGDVTETFVQRKAGRTVWVYLEPNSNVIYLTALETKELPPKASSPAPLATAPATPPPAASPSTPAPPVTPPVSPVAEKPAATAAPTPPPATSKEDPLYTQLITQGQVLLPLSFLPGKPDIGSDAQPILDRVVKMMKQHPELVLTIEGHTDSTGDPNYNVTLSTQRARAVRGMLIAGGIKRGRLSAVGLGGSQPIADDLSQEGREKNRRIELVLQTAEHPRDFHSPAPNGTNYYPRDTTQ